MPLEMKKQFFRVKQLADQTFLKAEKSEVLNNEELQIADQRVEVLKSAITSISKKLCPNGPTNDNKEKRLKKCLEYQLGSTFLEESRDGRECVLFQDVLRDSGRIEHDLAQEFAEHEKKVEDMVFMPLQKVLDNEIPAITKHKHNLRKYCLDKDSASNRYHSTKKETLKDDMEEADTKVEQSRDALAIEMFNFLAKENELSSTILQLLKLQRGYHESALKNLETIIPELEKKIGDSSTKRVFGESLEEHLRVTGRKLAYPLEICITTLAEFGMSEEGLFRIAGGMSKVKRLKSAIDSGCFSVLIPEYRDVHVLASTLKLYLRELPEPLLTSRLHDEWMNSLAYPENQRLDIVRNLLSRLPTENFTNLAYLIQFLSTLTHHTENKMTSSNIAIVMAPNLLWSNKEEINVNMGNCVTINMLVELFIKEVNTLFPEDMTKYVSIHSFIPAEDEMTRSVNNGKSLEHLDTSMENILDSPRPNQRKKKPAAPVPPNNAVHYRSTNHDTEEKASLISNTSSNSNASYPSGSSTLNRPSKAREPNKVKATVGVNTEENDLSLSRKKSLSRDDLKNNTSQFISQESNNLVSDNSSGHQPSGTLHTRIVTPVTVTSVCVSKPVQKPVIQTTVTHHVGSAPPEHTPNSSPRPVAAPRSSLAENEKNSNFMRNSSPRSSGNLMTRSAEFNDVQLRRPELLDRPSKPEIPARPASLAPAAAKRSSIEGDPTSLQKTQCSVYSVASKEQPSIINVKNRNEKIMLGHDTQMAEKEKFLGHPQVPKQQANLENKFTDANANKDQPNHDKPHPHPPAKPSVPPKGAILDQQTENKLQDSKEHIISKLKQGLKKSKENLSDLDQASKPPRPGLDPLTSKSNEKLNEISPTKSGHVRTRSDGNIIEFLHTPPSPRSLNKPTEPPPPPPVAQHRPPPDSTDF